MLRFFACGNYGHALESARGEQGRIGIRSDGNVGFEPERVGAVENCAGNFRERSEQRFHAGKIEKNRVAGSIFYTRRKRLSTIEQRGMRGRFLQSRSQSQGEFGAEFGLRLGHSRREAQAHGFFIDRNNFFERRVAFEDDDGTGLQFRFGAERSGHGKIRNVDAGERHGVEFIS